MVKRSGKIQFLFWSFFFSILLYIWILWIGINTFILNGNTLMKLPSQEVALLFILYGLLSLLTLSGLVVSIMIGNTKYNRRFSAMVLIIFATIITAKGVFG